MHFTPSPRDQLRRVLPLLVLSLTGVPENRWPTKLMLLPQCEIDHFHQQQQLQQQDTPSGAGVCREQNSHLMGLFLSFMIFWEVARLSFMLSHVMLPSPQTMSQKNGVGGAPISLGICRLLRDLCLSQQSFPESPWDDSQTIFLSLHPFFPLQYVSCFTIDTFLHEVHASPLFLFKIYLLYSRHCIN